MMEKLPRQVYTGEFRRQAVELVTREGLSIAEASRRLSLSPKTLTKWVRRAKNGVLPDAEQDFRVARPDEVWTADITYVPTAEGWLYVAAIKDLFAGEIVGRSFGERMTTELVVRALEQAVSARRPMAGLIHHSDRGSQYCSREYQGLLVRYGMRASMSRKGNCYDNAPIESFWGTLKTELVHHRRYQTRLEAAREIAEYIDLFYNRQRRQARLNYLSPAAYTQQFMRQRLAA